MILHVPYFIDFSPQVLLISVPARTRVQFEGGNKTRACSISHGMAALMCGHYLRAGLILLSSARARSAGSIRGREEIEEIWYF